MNLQQPESFKPNTAGAWLGMPMDQYQAAPGWSGSDLLTLMEWPAKADLRKRGLAKSEPSAAMQYGTMGHSAIIDGLPLSDLFYLRPDTYGEGKKWNANANECKAWLAAHDDKPVLTEDQAETFNLEVNAVRGNPLASSLLAGGFPEVSLFAYVENDDGSATFCKGRVDYLIQRDGKFIVPDLKVVRDASTRAMQRVLVERKYHMKAALYRALIERLAGEIPVEFFILALEKGNPPRVNPYRLADDAINVGQMILDDALKLRRRCALANRWPDFPDMPEDGHYAILDLPEWNKPGADVDDLEGMTEVET